MSYIHANAIVTLQAHTLILACAHERVIRIRHGPAVEKVGPQQPQFLEVIFMQSTETPLEGSRELRCKRDQGDLVFNQLNPLMSFAQFLSALDEPRMRQQCPLWHHKEPHNMVSTVENYLSLSRNQSQDKGMEYIIL